MADIRVIVTKVMTKQCNGLFDQNVVMELLQRDAGLKYYFQQCSKGTATNTKCMAKLIHIYIALKVMKAELDLRQTVKVLFRGIVDSNNLITPICTIRRH